MSLYDMLDQQGNMATAGLENAERAKVQNSIFNRNVRDENLGALMGAGLEGADAYQTYRDRPKQPKPPATTAPAATGSSDSTVSPQLAVPNPFIHLDPLSQQSIYDALATHGYGKPE